MTPKRYNWPDPQAALVIYGSHGNGKYVAFSDYLGWVYGDVSILISNIMYWLTNRDIPPPPPPPSVIQIDQKVAEINATLNMLSLKLTHLRDSIDQLNKQVPQLNEITSQMLQLSQSISALTNQVNKLSKRQPIAIPND
ncbi:MAG: hypothetical protein QW782_01210 [Candidatus Bathyarchaeia archaeon]